jgi:hypothetical protein
MIFVLDIVIAVDNRVKPTLTIFFFRVPGLKMVRLRTLMVA